MRPILLVSTSVNQRSPSGPAVMRPGSLDGVGMANSSAAVMTPAVVMRPILLASASVNQSLPSGPMVMSIGALLAVGVGNSTRAPVARFSRPILATVLSANQRLPSGPSVIPIGQLLTVRPANSVMTVDGTQRSSSRSIVRNVLVPRRTGLHVARRGSRWKRCNMTGHPTHSGKPRRRGVVAAGDTGPPRPCGRSQTPSCPFLCWNQAASLAGAQHGARYPCARTRLSPPCRSPARCSCLTLFLRSVSDRRRYDAPERSKICARSCLPPTILHLALANAPRSAPKRLRASGHHERQMLRAGPSPFSMRADVGGSLPIRRLRASHGIRRKSRGKRRSLARSKRRPQPADKFHSYGAATGQVMRGHSSLAAGQ